MDNENRPVPFVVNFAAPIVGIEQEMMLLRYENDDGSRGVLGLRFEAIRSLLIALAGVPAAGQTLRPYVIKSLEEDVCPQL